MSVPISDRLFLNYLQCKYKAYLKLAGKCGIKGEYEIFLDAQSSAYRRSAREHFQQINQIIPLPESIATFKDVKKQQPALATDVAIANDRHDLTLDAIKLAATSSSQKPVYNPIIFLPHHKTTKQDKLLLAFCGLALSHEQKTEPSSGRFIFGDKLLSSKVQLPSLIKAAGKIEKEITKLMEAQTAPALRLNDHCKMCEFQASCMAAAKEKDDLSLLSALNEKEINKLHNKGIFTVIQYSYTFRPRRKRKGAKVYLKKHLIELQALAIRNNKIYVYERPIFPATNTQIYIDVEGDPFKNYYYLIGIVIVEN